MKWNELLIMEIQKSIPSALVLEIETLSYDEFHIHMFYDTVVCVCLYANHLWMPRKPSLVQENDYYDHMVTPSWMMISDYKDPTLNKIWSDVICTWSETDGHGINE